MKHIIRNNDLSQISSDIEKEKTIGIHQEKFKKKKKKNENRRNQPQIQKLFGKRAPRSFPGGYDSQIPPLFLFCWFFLVGEFFHNGFFNRQLRWLGARVLGEKKGVL